MKSIPSQSNDAVFMKHKTSVEDLFKRKCIPSHSPLSRNNWEFDVRETISQATDGKQAGPKLMSSKFNSECGHRIEQRIKLGSQLNTFEPVNTTNARESSTVLVQWKAEVRVSDQSLVALQSTDRNATNACPTYIRWQDG